MGLAHDDDGITRRFARRVVESGWPIQNECKAVGRVRMVPLVTDPHMDVSLKYP